VRLNDGRYPVPDQFSFTRTRIFDEMLVKMLMKNSTLNAPLIGLAMVCVGGRAQTIQAQAANPPSRAPQVTITEQVEVVATRVPEAPHDVSASIEVIDGDTIRAIGAITLADALSLAAGVGVAPAKHGLGLAVHRR
jgi:outer membrane receptor protein involved in Fe transport